MKERGNARIACEICGTTYLGYVNMSKRGQFLIKRCTFTGGAYRSESFRPQVAATGK